MAKAKQFMLLFWKNWCLSKRAPIRTLFEICLPLFYILLLVLLRAFVVKDKTKDRRDYTQFSVNALPKGLETASHGKQWDFAFSPNTSDVKGVMESVSKKLGLRFGPMSGFKTEDDMVSFLVNAPPIAGFLGGVYFEQTPDNANVKYKLRLSSRARNSKKKKFKNFGGDPTTAWNTQFTFPAFQVPGPRSPNNTHGGPPDYYDEGFLCMQHAIDRALLEYKTGADALANITVGLRRYPYPAYIDDPFILVIQQTLPLLLMLSLVVTALYIVKDIVHEKERKLKESLKMMGLSGWLHWAAWFTKYLLFLLVTVILASVLFTTKFNNNGRILNHSDPSVVFVFLLLFSISSIMFCFFVSVFFSKASIAAAAGGIIWFCSYIPYFFVAQSYDTMSIGLKLFSCILSNGAMGMGSLLIGKFEGRGTGAQWSNINQGPSVDDTMTLGLVMWMMVADSLLYGFITWYIEAVFPGEYGTPQRCYFPFQPSYWCGKNRTQDTDDAHYHNGYLPDGVAPDFLEKEPTRLNTGVEVRNLKKVFSTEKNGKKIAVNKVCLNMYEGQITVLLGHNGAGKTTLMSMLTGLFPPTSGTAVVNGCSITDDMAGVRRSLGLCPQHDVLFDRLTVSEHLWMFGLLKGCSRRQVKTEVDSMIRRIGLEDKRDTQTRALSGGMKRKLSVGIALIGDSKVVMLDEPTSGMDPSARRFTWNLLQQERRGRTILLTTHYMDEADLLGDRIAIMAEGNIKCCGSSLFLKNKYGVGYHMAIVKASHCHESKVTEVVQSFVPTAQLESNVGAELSYILPSEATGRFEELFTELESRGKELGIASFGASVTTMEEVFLKVGEEVDDSITKILQQKDADNEPEDAQDDYAIDVSDTNRLGVFSGGTSGAHCASAQHNCRFRLAFQRWYAMFVKRLLHSKRHKLSIISQLLLPLVFTLMALINAKTFPQPENSPALALNVSTFGEGNVVLYSRSVLNGSTAALRYSDVYKDQFKGTNTQTSLVKTNISDFLITEAKRLGIGFFNLHHLIAATFDQQKTSLVNITAWFNNQAFHSTAISLAAVHDGLLKSMLGSNHSISTINHPLPRTTKDTIDDLSRNGVGFLISFNMLFGMAFLASSFVVFLVQERSNKAKHVQFVSGVTPVSYWTSAYLWDLINFLVPVITLVVLFAAFDVPAYTGPRLGYMFLLLMLYGWAIIPLMYIFSFIFRTAANAFVLLTIFNIITGLATLLTVFILSIPGLDLLDVADALKWAFLVLPNYCLGQGVGDIFSNYDTITIFNEAVNACVKDFHITRAGCEQMIKKMAGSRLQFQDNYLAWDNPGIGRYLVFLSCEGLFYFMVVLVIEYGVFRRLLLFCRRVCQPTVELIELSASTSTAEDDDVFEEKRRIACRDGHQDVLVIKELTKVFRERLGSGSLVAVDHLSLGVPLGECFGLLGINGAGKTTTFRMLTGDETMTSGTASVDNFDIRSSMNQVRQRIGYCPQFDALIDQMTGRELLYMYARLRGVTEADIPASVDELIESLLLSAHADKLAKNLSGGNKRKLSTAIALVGDPPVIFLDEPTTGMDPVARRLLWDALSRVRAEGRCIVITSHSMEECDALCTRLAIMVNGRFKCLGSPQHLKNKFGEGFTLLAKVGGIPPDTGPLKSFIEGSFSGSILKDEHLGMVHYHITDTSVSWAQVFGTIERNKLEYDIEDYSVSQTTLEQVFLNFARGQRQEDE